MQRLRCKARDGSEGWATLSHLRPVVLPAYAIGRRCVLLEKKDVKSETKEVLLQGDVVELLEESQADVEADEAEEADEAKEPKEAKEAKEAKELFGFVQTRSGKYGWIFNCDQVLQPL